MQTVFKNHPTTSVPQDEIVSLLDDELLDFCEVHCFTPQARFRRDTVGRLFKMAGSTIKASQLPEWVAVEPDVMTALVRAARNEVERRSCRSYRT